jgi:hypothetical protein
MRYRIVRAHVMCGVALGIILLQGGAGTHRVAMRCPSSRCVRGATGSGAHWGSPGSQGLHEGGISRPLILTVPAMCRPTFDQNAAVVLSAFRRGGGPCLEECSRDVRGQALRGGSSTVRHPHGRQGQAPPQRHRLATRGGSAGQGERGEQRHAFPYDRLRRPWPWPLWSMGRQTLKTDALPQGVETGFWQYPHGLVPTVPKGHVPSQYQSVARAVATEVGRPPRAVRRSERSDGAPVTSHARSQRPARVGTGHGGCRNVSRPPAATYAAPRVQAHPG